MGANDLKTNGHNVAVIENHYNDSYANAGSNARIAYYEITGFPCIVIDGIQKHTAGDHNISLYPVYLPVYQARYAIKTNFGITINGNFSGNNYNLSVVVDRYGESPFASNNLVLHLVLTQSNIPFTWQGQTHVESVNRIMVPNSNGTVINMSTQTQVTVPLSFTFNTGWGGSITNHDFELIAWVQDLNTKEVIDAQKKDLASIPPVFVNQMNNDHFLLNLYPNPASEYTNIDFYLKDAAKTKLDIYNINGQLTKSLLDADCNSGQKTVVWDLTDFSGMSVANGLYLFKIVSGNKTATAKIFVNR